MRVIVDHREGFAYAGTLDEAVVLEALAEARDNAQFGEPDEFNGLATPDGVEAAELDLWPEGLAASPPPTRWPWPSSSRPPPRAATRA